MLMLLATGAAAEERPLVPWAEEKPEIDGLVMSPPAKWAFEPIGPVEVHYLPQPEVTEICTKGAGEFEDIGCAWPATPESDVCVIYIAKELHFGLKARVLEHEKAHCNGWPGDHPRY